MCHPATSRQANVTSLLGVLLVFLSIALLSAHSLIAMFQKTQRYRSCYFSASEGKAMSLVRLLGFRTLGCGCVIGQYRELATSRELTYVEEKGVQCEMHGHRRNHTVHAERFAAVPVLVTAKAS
jgi:hypothetical protein